MWAERERMTLERVQQIVARQLDISAGEVIPSAHLRDDLGADALDLVELVMAFDREFDDVLDEDAGGIQTVGEYVTYIAGKQNIFSQN